MEGGEGVNAREICRGQSGAPAPRCDTEEAGDAVYIMSYVKASGWAAPRCLISARYQMARLQSPADGSKGDRSGNGWEEMVNESERCEVAERCGAPERCGEGGGFLSFPSLAPRLD